MGVPCGLLVVVVVVVLLLLLLLLLLHAPPASSASRCGIPALHGWVGLGLLRPQTGIRHIPAMASASAGTAHVAWPLASLALQNQFDIRSCTEKWVANGVPLGFSKLELKLLRQRKHNITEVTAIAVVAVSACPIAAFLDLHFQCSLTPWVKSKGGNLQGAAGADLLKRHSCMDAL